jgi:hypothetical protein
MSAEDAQAMLMQAPADDAPFEPAKPDVEAELAALQAELDAADTKGKKLAVATKAPARVEAVIEGAMPEAAATVKATLTQQGDAFIAPPGTNVVHVEGAAALKEALDTVRKEAPATKPAGLNYHIDMGEFRDDIKVSSVNLDDCMMQQAGLRAYHGEQAAYADRQYAQLKLRHEIVEAKIYDQVRKKLLADGEKVTEKMVENAVKQNPEWAQSKMRVIEAETIANVRRACTDALKDRKDMLVQLGADRREEGKGQLRIMEADSAHRDKRAAADAAVASRLRKD